HGRTAPPAAALVTRSRANGDRATGRKSGNSHCDAFVHQRRVGRDLEGDRASGVREQEGQRAYQDDAVVHIANRHDPLLTLLRFPLVVADRPSRSSIAVGSGLALFPIAVLKWRFMTLTARASPGGPLLR